MVVGAGDIANTIELYKAQVFDDEQNIQITSRRMAKTMRMQPQFSNVTIGNFKRHNSATIMRIKIQTSTYMPVSSNPQLRHTRSHLFGEGHEGGHGADHDFEFCDQASLVKFYQVDPFEGFVANFGGEL